jgi:hypothetical protein
MDETMNEAAWACGEPDGKVCTVPDCPWCGANPTEPHELDPDPVRTEESTTYRQDMIDAGRGHLLR